MRGKAVIASASYWIRTLWRVICHLYPADHILGERAYCIGNHHCADGTMVGGPWGPFHVLGRVRIVRKVVLAAIPLVGSFFWPHEVLAWGGNQPMSAAKGMAERRVKRYIESALLKLKAGTLPMLIKYTVSCMHTPSLSSDIVLACQWGSLKYAMQSIPNAHLRQI